MKVKVDDKPFTIEELCYMSRPEAIAMLRRIEELIEDTIDTVAADCALSCGCGRTNTTLDYFIDASLLNENTNCSVKESCK